MRFHLRRLGELIAILVGAALCINYLFPRTSEKIQKIAVEADLFKQYWPNKWSEELEEAGVRLVVFGDSWVDDSVQEGEKGKGRSWTGILCDAINCTSHYNFAGTQPSTDFPQKPTAGVLTVNTAPKLFASTSSPALPDLATQISQYLTLLPRTPRPTETIFILSFGFWDIYHLASLDLETSKVALDKIATELFTQLDRLYQNYGNHALAHGLGKDEEDEEEGEVPFRVVVPKLVDPTLLPGWMARPKPLPPASVAEEQKNAVYLTEHWNTMLTNSIGEWLKTDEEEENDLDIPRNESSTGFSQGLSDHEEETEKAGKVKGVVGRQVVKDVFYYDLPMYIVNMLIEHQLQTEGIVDHKGLGTKGSPFRSISQTCLRESLSSSSSSPSSADLEEFVEVNGKMVCPRPAEYLMWDGFRVGSVANEEIGNAVGEMVTVGMSVKKLLGRGAKDL
ncbi:hypothetical protein BJ878DRAFT_197517 [Calycina marina]|uniref:Uncharacterized protein n=1 Tax=Calycina marina TaxID=1763456 RepID=A0A9P7ZC53_9HELO|nr:hypothetical protein BJ878DRAFT_197517 [Calycina marina]